MQTVLLIMPKFNDYDKDLILSLKKIFLVDSFIYEEKINFKINIIFRVFFKIIKIILNENIYYKFCDGYRAFFCFPKFNKAIEKKCNKLKYDYLLVIKGYGLNSNTVEGIKAEKKVIYQWDSQRRIPSVKNIYEKFDKCFTFDKIDAEKFGSIYLPNFVPYNKKNINYRNESETNHIAFFVGIYTEDRLNNLIKIKKFCRDNNIKTNFSLLDKRKFLTDRNKITEYNDIIINNPICPDLYRQEFNEASHILELSRPNEAGYSQRYFEALMLNKKIILQKLNGDILVINDHDFSTENFTLDDLFIDQWVHFVLIKSC